MGSNETIGYLYFGDEVFATPTSPINVNGVDWQEIVRYNQIGYVPASNLELINERSIINKYNVEVKSALGSGFF